MRLVCLVENAKILTKKVIQGKVKPDGTRNIYYQLGIKAGEDIGEINCTLEIFDTVILDKSYNLEFSYETKFDKNFIKIEKIYPATLEKK